MSLLPGIRWSTSCLMLMTSTINTGDDSLGIYRQEHSRFREADLPPGQSSWIMGEEYGRGLWPTTTVGDNSQGRQLGMTAEDNSRGRQSRTTVRRPGCTTGLHTTIKKWKLQGVQRGVQCNRVFVNKYKTKKKMVHPRINSFASAQSQLIC